jgi:hypothetical protein
MGAAMFGSDRKEQDLHQVDSVHRHCRRPSLNSRIRIYSNAQPPNQSHITASHNMSRLEDDLELYGGKPFSLFPLTPAHSCAQLNESDIDHNEDLVDPDLPPTSNNNGNNNNDTSSIHPNQINASGAPRVQVGTKEETDERDEGAVADVLGEDGTDEVGLRDG